jgi:hypothetical protein
MTDDDDQRDDDQRGDEPAPPPPPAKKKKKKKRAEAEAAEVVPARRAELDAAGRERPRFLLSFPDDPELDRLVLAFERGDFATVRTDAPALAERAEDPRVRDAALELRRRLEPDPLMKYLLLASVVLLMVLVLHAYSHK